MNEQAAYRFPVTHWSDATLRSAVCRATPEGQGPIICGRECESYSGCELGHEWVRRGLKDTREWRTHKPRMRVQTVNENAQQLLEKMRRLREESGIGTSEMAKHCGVSRASVQNWEDMKSMPGIDKVCLELEALGYEMVIVKRKSEEAAV